MSLAAAVLLSALAAGPARAAGPEECVEVKGFGCFHPGTADPKSPDRGLLVYLRGHCNTYGDDRCVGDFGGSVPDRSLLASARHAFAWYGLEDAAAARGLSVLVSGSSHVGLDKAVLAGLEGRLGVKFTRMTLAAHSGGWAGLLGTLAGASSLPRLERLVLLDAFYFDAGAARTIQARLESAKASCRGYYTEQGKLKEMGGVDYGWHFRTRLKPALSSCEIDARSDHGHYAGVAACLKPHLAGLACPAKVDPAKVRRKVGELGVGMP